MLDHGGGIKAASARYGRAVEDWIDLSTGINPHGWPVPTPPAAVWQRLPEDDGQLEAAARHYYQAPQLLAMAGSQAAIQLLPRLRSASRAASRSAGRADDNHSAQVAFLSPGYAEHPHAWREAGHQVSQLSAAAIDARIEAASGPTSTSKAAALDIVILCRPNNPDGQTIAVSDLRRWHRTLARRGGWLIIDEAFADCSAPSGLAASLSHNDTPPGLIVLRSPGKFFGLAGLRLGFMIAAPALLDAAREQAGPWSVSHPARWVGNQALRDHAWQTASRQRLAADRQRLDQLLQRYQSQHQLNLGGGTDLFRWLPGDHADAVYQHFAAHGILARCFEQPPALRLGLPADQAAWQRLEHALATLNLAQ